MQIEMRALKDLRDAVCLLARLRSNVSVHGAFFSAPSEGEILLLVVAGFLAGIMNAVAGGRTSLKVTKATSLSVSLVLFIGLLDNNGRLGDPTLPVRPGKKCLASEMPRYLSAL
jgi:hypothetical protein